MKTVKRFGLPVATRPLFIMAALYFTTSYSRAQVTADKVKVHYTHDVDNGPDAFNHEVRFDFKQRAVLQSPGEGKHAGLMTIAPWADNTGNRHHQLNFNDGGVFYRTGLPDATTWGTWRRLVVEQENGNVGIGIATPNEKLAVNGNIRAKEIKVETANWPDYVFSDDYQLPGLKETEAYIKVNRRLPGMPSAEEAEAAGISLGEMNRKLLEKVEELTLYLIRKDQELTEVRQRVSELENKLEQR